MATPCFKQLQSLNAYKPWTWFTVVKVLFLHTYHLQNQSDWKKQSNMLQVKNYLYWRYLGWEKDEQQKVTVFTCTFKDWAAACKLVPASWTYNSAKMEMK